MRYFLIFCFLVTALSMGKHSPKRKQDQILRRQIRNVRKFSRSLQKEIEEDKKESEANKDQILAFSNNLTQQVEESKANKDQIITLSNNLTQQGEEIITLSNNLAPLMDSPYLYVCGYKGVSDGNNVIITYDSLYINHTNIPYSGGLDLDTGAFTAPISGIYTVSMSGYIAIHTSHFTYISFRKNEINILANIATAINDGIKTDTFSRELPLHLQQGEKLELYIEDNQSGIFRVTFCITLNLAVDSISSQTDMQTSNDEVDEHMH